ncbi:restriction endonuclease subunit S [Caldifermentibacillus hisashii]|uniref:restriction endonuclease subunit S n=1 Tax=Caldifermentibacillus hisashii TaxID=996558 RepID=UPI003D22F1FC
MSCNHKWFTVFAEDYCKKVTDGTHDSPKKQLEGKYLITSRHLKEFSLDLNNAYRISESDFNKINERSKVDTWDIMISMIGTVGNIYLEKSHQIDYAIKNVGLFKMGGDVEKAKWLYYYLKSPKAQEYIKVNMRGSTQQYIPLGSLRKLPIKVSAFNKEMNTITHILSTLDEKIETNNQINEKLEEMAQALFKHWFVDFEFPNENGKPYKSSGGEMVESELGEIPKGWKVDKLSSIAEIIMGQSPKSDTYNTDKIGLPLLNGATDFQNKNLSPSKYTSDPKKVGEKGDFVFGVRATIGLVTELDDRYAIGRGSGIARAFDNMYKEFLYEILNIAFSNFQYTASGSVYLNVSKNDLEDYKLVIPDINILRRYHKITKSILNQKENLKRENAVLEKLRDTLLPKLMSGEIRVPLDDEVLSEKN